ncbi:MAG: GGDEF domain-containing protein [Rhodopseudomonas palustris]|nr:GGDEF domain-containing protein [Rhodopseudomonas palustris]
MARRRFESSIVESRVDRLTGFLTRTRFEELFAATAERASRYGETFVLGMFDVDGLKKVNDRFGHLSGDRLLRAVADAIRDASRKSGHRGTIRGRRIRRAVLQGRPGFGCGRGRTRSTRHCASGRSTWRERRTPRASPTDSPSRRRLHAFEELTAAADLRLYAVKAAHRAAALAEPGAGTA